MRKGKRVSKKEEKKKNESEGGVRLGERKTK
jgi:hypothetical protein